jgi:hypothetical protein
MDARSLVRRMSLGLVGTGIGACLLALTVRADEVGGVTSARAGIVVHDAAQTLRDYCRADEAGTLWLTLPGGSRYELVTSTAGLPNPGDGAFHPFDASVVATALSGVRYPMTGVAAEVFILPFPRRDALESAAGPGLVLLAPGVRPLASEQQHAILTHELGHVVQQALMPDHDQDAWSRYRALRGIIDENQYSAASPHADRPHEIFAEDFRALFGDPLATGSGSIENASLADPATVTGLEPFLRELAEPGLAGRLIASPNPARGPIALVRSGIDARVVDLFDVHGRRIASVNPEPARAGWVWHWDGSDTTGRPLARGVVLARERGSRAPATRISVLR